MTEQQVKDKILIHVKGLKSTNEKIYRKSLTYLFSKFFEPDSDIDLDELDLLDQYQLIQSILLSLIKGLIQESDYENLAIVRNVYKKIQIQVTNSIYDQMDLDCYNLTNEFFDTKLNEIINKQIK